MSKKPPPLLGYNTNVRHLGNRFHIQTEDSGVDHPHIITHLFVEGTILATKKTAYEDVLETEGWESAVREMMKDQHRAMFIELRDGVHDEIAERIFAAKAPARAEAEAEAAEAGEIEALETADDEVIFDDTALEEDKLLVDLSDSEARARVTHPPPKDTEDKGGGGVRVIRPANMTRDKAEDNKTAQTAANAESPKTGTSLRYRSVFDTPDDDGEFGENLITDKSLDEVILSYLTDELDE